MNNSSKKLIPSPKPYTQEEFSMNFNKMLAKFGLSVKKKEEQPEVTKQTKTYEVKFFK